MPRARNQCGGKGAAIAKTEQPDMPRLDAGKHRGACGGPHQQRPMRHCRQQRSTQRHLRQQIARQPHSARRTERRAVQHQPGLQIALHPARPLVQPRLQFRGGFLVCLRRDHRRAISQPGQPQPDIRILGDIPGIPAASRDQRISPEIIAGSAQRQRSADAREERQPDAEVDRIFDLELRSEPAFPAIVDAERRLHHGQLAVAGPECFHRRAQLVAGRPVLGVEYRHDIATREMQAIVQCLGFSARRARRYGDHVETPVRLHGLRDLHGLGIVGLDQQLHVQPSGGIVETVDGAHEIGKNVRLAIERDQQRDQRQVARRSRAHACGSLRHQRKGHRHQPDPYEQQEDAGQCRNGDRDCRRGRHEQGGHVSSNAGPSKQALPGREAVTRTQGGVLVRQSVARGAKRPSLGETARERTFRVCARQIVRSPRSKALWRMPVVQSSPQLFPATR